MNANWTIQGYKVSMSGLHHCTWTDGVWKWDWQPDQFGGQVHAVSPSGAEVWAQRVPSIEAAVCYCRGFHSGLSIPSTPPQSQAEPPEGGADEPG